jgi:hypothetical protein
MIGPLIKSQETIECDGKKYIVIKSDDLEFKGRKKTNWYQLLEQENDVLPITDNDVAKDIALRYSKLSFEDLSIRIDDEVCIAGTANPFGDGDLVFYEIKIGKKGQALTLGYFLQNLKRILSEKTDESNLQAVVKNYEALRQKNLLTPSNELYVKHLIFYDAVAVMGFIREFKSDRTIFRADVIIFNVV